jgi:hypothetical protein
MYWRRRSEIENVLRLARRELAGVIGMVIVFALCVCSGLFPPLSKVYSSFSVARVVWVRSFFWPCTPFKHNTFSHCIEVRATKFLSLTFVKQFSMGDCLLNETLHQDISFPRYANEALLINELSGSYLYAPSSLAGMSQPLRQRRLAHTQKTNQHAMCSAVKY